MRVNFSPIIRPSIQSGRPLPISTALTRWSKIELFQPLGAVVFDSGRVFTDFDWSRAGRALRVAEGLSIGPEEIAATTAAISESPEKTEFEKGKISAGQFFEAMNIRLRLSRTPLDEFFRIYNDIFTPIPGTNDLAVRLQKAGITTIMLPDTSPAHFDHLANIHSAYRAADYRVISFETGFFKSDPSHFNFIAVLKILKRLQIPPGAVLYFDDLVKYTDLGISLGLPSWTFTSAGEAEQVIKGIWPDTKI